MNHLVFLDARAGELEKILSGLKTMVVKEVGPAQGAARPVRAGDSLYFMRNTEECALRVKAIVVRVLFITKHQDEDLSCTLKEMQPRLQLTEDQYNFWAAKPQVMLVEFASAQKIPVVWVAAEKIAGRSGWIAFEEFGVITKGVSNV